ncbi:MAG: hypothetical protein ACJAYF_003218 [Arenicella sp.]|jgi:hypothetical protein
MTFLKKSIPFALGLFLGVFLWAILELLFTSLEDTDVQVVVAIIAATGTMVSGIILAIVNNSRVRARELEIQEKIREREIDESHRGNKVEIYNGFLKLVSAFMRGENSKNSKKTPNSQKAQAEIEKFQNGIMLWGGPQVISAYLNYRKESDKGTKEMFTSIDLLYRCLREDIGLSNKGLDSYEMIQMYLSDPNDIEQVFKT